MWCWANTMDLHGIHEYFKSLVISLAPFVCSELPAISPSPLNTSYILIYAILKWLTLCWSCYSVRASLWSSSFVALPLPLPCSSSQEAQEAPLPLGKSPSNANPQKIFSRVTCESMQFIQAFATSWKNTLKQANKQKKAFYFGCWVL